MHKILVEMPVEWLSIGHYVSRLDRPWTGTPFLFQGFEISTQDEIAQLQSLCTSVHVEMTAEEAAAQQRTGLVPTRPAEARASASSTNDRPPLTATIADAAPDNDLVPLKDELPNARRIFGQAREAITRVFDRLRHGGGSDLLLLETAVDSMIDSVFRNRDALNWLACMKQKDDYLYSHALSCSVWALAFGRHLGFDKASLKVLGIGAMLLDVGKTQLPDELLKSDARPTPDAWVTLRTHVAQGIRLLNNDPPIDGRIPQMIATHHERLDGSGYPDALQGDAIPLVGRIAGIVDCYDAMTSNRPYAKAKSAYETILELKKLGGSWFPAELIELFIQAVGVFPTGTLVELNTGEVGVVVAQNRFRRLRPEIMLILDSDKRVRSDFLSIDLQMRAHQNAAGEPPLWITRGLEPGAHGIDPTEFFL